MEQGPSLDQGQPDRAVLLVDYSSLLYRAWHSTPSSVRNHAVHGLLEMLARVVADRRPTGLALAVDEDWRPAFRVDALPSYKAHRVAAEEGSGEIDAQEQIGREILRGMGIAVVGSAGFEAEDVIATLVTRIEGRVEILSGDRDLFALVGDPRVKVLYPVKGVRVLAEVDRAEIERRYQIPGDRYLDYALLRGDPSDGLPGVTGIGEQTASRLLRQYGSLQAAQEAGDLPASVASRLSAARDYLERACRVVPPVSDVPLPGRMDFALPPRGVDEPHLRDLAEEHGLAGAAGRLRTALGA